MCSKGVFMRNKMILTEALGKLNSTDVAKDAQSTESPKMIQDEGFKYFLATTIAEDIERRSKFKPTAVPKN